MSRLNLLIGVGLSTALLIGCQSAAPVSSLHPTETSVSTPAVTAKANYNKPGFETYEEKGRLWVFRTGSPELAEYLEKGAPAKAVIRPNAGPSGMTLRGPDSETLQEYIATKPGFVTIVEKGRLWVFRDGSSDLADYLAKGAPAKQVIRPNAGPMGMTLKATDAEILDAYLSQN